MWTASISKAPGDHRGRERRASRCFRDLWAAGSEIACQCQKLGGQARRFGYDQGDLKTVEGRKKLFTDVCWQCPRHLWFAPSCHPWCAWSQLNGSKSEAAWADMVDRRETHLYQIALGIVLHRWQDRTFKYLSRRWFPTFVFFTPVWGRFRFWLIFFRWDGLKPPTSIYYIYTLQVMSIIFGWLFSRKDDIVLVKVYFINISRGVCFQWFDFQGTDTVQG